MTKKIKEQQELDEFHLHEALDRCDVIAVGFDMNIMKHPVIRQDKELKSLAAKISGMLGELYQELGNKRFNYNNANNDKENQGAATA